MRLRPMKVGFYTVLLCVALGIEVSAQEGYILEEETTMPPVFGMSDKISITKTWMTKNKMKRNEGAKNQTTILRSDIGKIWLIDHSDTTYTELSREMFQGLAMMGLMMFGVTVDSVTGDPIIPDPLFKRTGRKRNIGDWNCFEVVAGGGKGGFVNGMIEPVVMWVSGDTGIEKDLYGRLMRQLMGGLGEKYDSLFRQIEDLGGYPVLIEIKAMGFKMVQKLKSAERCSLPDSVFSLPEGYKKKEGLFVE